MPIWQKYRICIITFYKILSESASTCLGEGMKESSLMPKAGFHFIIYKKNTFQASSWDLPIANNQAIHLLLDKENNFQSNWKACQWHLRVEFP